MSYFQMEKTINKIRNKFRHTLLMDKRERNQNSECTEVKLNGIRPLFEHTAQKSLSCLAQEMTVSIFKFALHLNVVMRM